MVQKLERRLKLTTNRQTDKQTNKQKDRQYKNIMALNIRSPIIRSGGIKKTSRNAIFTNKAFMTILLLAIF